MALTVGFISGKFGVFNWFWGRKVWGWFCFGIFLECEQGVVSIWFRSLLFYKVHVHFLLGLIIIDLWLTELFLCKLLLLNNKLFNYTLPVVTLCHLLLLLFIHANKPLNILLFLLFHAKISLQMHSFVLIHSQVAQFLFMLLLLIYYFYCIHVKSLTALASDSGNTFAQTVRGLSAGVIYRFRVYVKKLASIYLK